MHNNVFSVKRVLLQQQTTSPTQRHPPPTAMVHDPTSMVCAYCIDAMTIRLQVELQYHRQHQNAITSELQSKLTVNQHNAYPSSAPKKPPPPPPKRRTPGLSTTNGNSYLPSNGKVRNALACFSATTLRLRRLWPLMKRASAVAVMSLVRLQARLCQLVIASISRLLNTARRCAIYTAVAT